MKKILISLILLLITGVVYPQFSDDLGYDTGLPGCKKTIYKGFHFCVPGAIPLVRKLDRNAKRFRFRAHMYDNCSYNPETLNENNGWNKIGRITFAEDLIYLERFKMHLGWVFRDDPAEVRFSLYYHNDVDDKLFVAHRIDEMSFNPDASPLVDMYLGRWAIGMIISNWYNSSDDSKCIGIREDNSSLSVDKDSYVARTFYFGGSSKAPHKMEMRFHDLWVDEAGYQTKFNSNDIMTWNLSEFVSGDDFAYTAGKVIHGSVADPGLVQYRSNDPNKEHQKCIIHAGASITFTAGESVHLHPGFHAKDGSYFRAVPEPATKINIQKTPMEFDEQITYEAENAKLIELSFYTDQTQDSLVYGKQFYANPISSVAKTSIDTILPNNKYYLVAYFYSGKGSQKRCEGWINNANNASRNVYKNLSNTSADYSNTYYSNICTIYPNPSSGVFNIKFVEPSSIQSIEIKSMMGQTLFNRVGAFKNTIAIDISDKQKGVYILIIKTEKEVKTFQIVKN
jgi:hypothetical protein